MFVFTNMGAQNVAVNDVFTDGELILGGAINANQNYSILAFEVSGGADNGIVHVLNNSNTNVRTFTLEPNATGPNIAVVFFATTVSDTGVGYALLGYDTRVDNVDEFRVDKLNTNGTSESIMYFGGGAPQIAECIGGVLYFVIIADIYGFDPETSGLPNLNVGDGLLVAIDIATDNTIWTKMLGSEDIYSIEGTNDGNVFVSTSTGYKKISSSNGSTLLDVGVENSWYNHILQYDPHMDNIICVDNPDENSDIRTWNGDFVAHTNFQPYNHYNWGIQRIKSFANRLVAVANIGIGKIFMFDKSPDDESYNLIHRRSFETEEVPSFGLVGYLRLKEDSFTAVTKNVTSTAKTFFGTSVPGYGYVVYTVTLGTNPGQYISLNDISGTNNIVQVVENAYLVDDNFVSTDAYVGYCVFSEGHVPSVGTIIPTNWNLWQMNGGLVFMDIAETHKVKEDMYGRRYMDIIAKDLNGDTNNPSSKDYFNYRIFLIEAAPDTESPNALCQNYTLYLDAGGSGSIVSGNIDGGSTDNVGIVSSVLSQYTFDCDDLGANSVTLTVTDAAGNSDSCTATVTVVDGVNPTMLGQNVTANLDGNSSVTVPVANVDNGSYDNCSLSSLTLTPNTFTSTGTFSAMLEGTDQSGNSAGLSVTITVIDTVDGINPTEPTMTIGEVLDLEIQVVSSGSTDNVGVTGTEFYLDTNIDGTPNGNLVYTSGASQPVYYMYTGLDAGTSYEIYSRTFDAAGNVSAFSNIEVVTTTLDIEAEEILGFRMYPNPVRDVLYLETGVVKLLDVEVYDAVGKKVLGFENTFSSEEVELNVSNIVVGMYVLKVVTEEGKIGSYKFIKQ